MSILFFFFFPLLALGKNRERLFDKKNVDRSTRIANPLIPPWGRDAFRRENTKRKRQDLDSKLRYRSAGNAPFAAQSAPNDVRILSWLGAFGGAGLV